ncbi:molybdate ABC transporter substrate-binding protein [Orrella sp. JC864]|uniref:molybdate ABC transporter substrate-binding protein n=1 Tax=Orrella sp. JC864 TaxID=3120298 RepID=UPI0030092FA5
MPLCRFLCTAILACLPLLASAQALTISAAASLTDAFKEIAALFEAAHPGAKLRLNFAASGVLLQQIEQGAPVDVFASADQATMDRAAQAGRIDPASRRDFAANSLVLVAPVQDGPAIGALAELRQPGIRRIAIGKPGTVPVGRYTRQALAHAGLWESLQPRLVQADSVRQALDYVSRGEVEAGFVYRTDAMLMAGKVRILLTAGGHDPVTYPVAVVSDSKAASQARDFVDFLLQPPARQVLARYGFGQP